jgi:hypothetical protein
MSPEAVVRMDPAEKIVPAQPVQPVNAAFCGQLGAGDDEIEMLLPEEFTTRLGASRGLD